MRLIVCIATSLSLVVSPAFGEAAVLLKEVPVEYLGGVPGEETEDSPSGDLTITTESIIFESRKHNWEIPIDQVTYLSGGEFAKRRVKSALIGAVLLSPLFLFAMIGKKKRQIVMIEYSEHIEETTEGETPKLTGAAVIRFKPKGGRAIAIERALESATGLDVIKEGEEEESEEVEVRQNGESKE